MLAGGGKTAGRHDGRAVAPPAQHAFLGVTDVSERDGKPDRRERESASQAKSRDIDQHPVAELIRAVRRHDGRNVPYGRDARRTIRGAWPEANHARGVAGAIQHGQSVRRGGRQVNAVPRASAQRLLQQREPVRIQPERGLQHRRIHRPRHWPLRRRLVGVAVRCRAAPALDHGGDEIAVMSGVH
jgi:hypothetical protein